MKCVKQGQGSLSWKAALLSCSRVSGGCAWKIQGRSLSLAPVRTVNRNRSPRLKASGRQNNVGKGSRQNGSVTSGQGLALRAGADGLRNEMAGRVAEAGLSKVRGRAGQLAGAERGVWICRGAFRRTAPAARRRRAPGSRSDRSASFSSSVEQRST